MYLRAYFVVKASQMWLERGTFALFQLPQELPRFIKHHRDLPSLGAGIPGEQPMLARIPVSPRRAGSRRTAVHTASRLVVRGRRTTAAAAAGAGAAAWACQHRG